MDGPGIPSPWISTPGIPARSHSALRTPVQRTPALRIPAQRTCAPETPISSPLDPALPLSSTHTDPFTPDPAATPAPAPGHDLPGSALARATETLPRYDLSRPAPAVAEPAHETSGKALDTRPAPDSRTAPDNRTALDTRAPASSTSTTPTAPPRGRHRRRDPGQPLDWQSSDRQSQDGQTPAHRSQDGHTPDRQSSDGQSPDEPSRTPDQRDRQALSFLEPKARRTPRTDTVPAEHPAPVLPAAVGLTAGVLGLAGSVYALAWSGLLPRAAGLSALSEGGLGPVQGLVLVVSLLFALFGLAGLARGRVGRAWVLTLCGRYRGTVRQTGLMWVSPLMHRRRADVRLRHWRSEPMPAVDAQGLAVQVSVLVVWRIKDTARALLSVDGHEAYLRECVEAVVARVFPQMPADTGRNAPGRYLSGPSLRDAEAVGEELTRLVADEGRPVGLEVFSVQAVSLDYAPEVAAAVRRHRAAAWDAQHRDALVGSVLDSVEDTVNRLTSRGLVELDDYERKALVRDLTVAFCSARVADGSAAED
ncbi:hypothetical protein SLNWT_2395 [Streptomyces albus]|uniref:Band 7 domain-containing protein n=1 Tax=Streptomyces albus (strain ATCC 21838 / DSM 41398 / FERM P-419 / JCM 4703 / NBRC 107858) TaxID=1081613 RepID=A0A0B5EVQ6_STRA4|nr:hypothetical protein SLNWT_2395 [Streptomyces albus]